jgi:hypothetical protein
MRLPLAAALCAALVVAVAPSARAAVPTGNLLADPGGESGTGATDSATVSPPPGWTVSPNFTLVAYGTPEFLTTQDAQALGGGRNFFAGGPDGDVNTATQTVDVSAAAADLAGGGVFATLSAQLGGYATQADSATVTAQFESAPGQVLSTAQIGPVTAADRKDATTLLARSASVAVPAATRLIAVTITATRQEGQYNDGYADNVSLTLSTGTPPAYGKAVGVALASGTVLVQKPGGGAFAALKGSEGIPLGSVVDARKGKVTLTSVPKPGAAPQTATFYDGIFKVTQSGGITQLTLVEKLSCGKAGKASAAAGKKVKTRKLWGDGSGAFSTRGSYSAATVRGTRWLVQDSCTSTLTRVAKGVVAVRDLVRKRTVLVRAPHSYTARRR